ncbi:MAG: hypothetical protein JO325_01695, partial [Solirubrobacterales bacterium]|nr:hypothetical protein [Solirubrobacterales bacterium]
DAAQDALPRAAAAGVPAVELKVFEAWLELARDPASQPSPLPVAALPLLGVILETLLGRHEFETFERLAGLLLRSPLSRREQREILASMYLKYGFLASAAQEWMAVCEAQADGRALLGLAQVAAAQGELEDAAVFATEALRHDPNNPAARDILARRSGAREAVPAGL